MRTVPSLLVPLEITSSMITSSTIAEPSSAETAWVSGGTYIAGDIRIRATTHRKYMAKLDHASITLLPEADPTRWEDIGATDKYAMFDGTQTSLSQTTTTMTAVVKPGFFNAIAIYGAVGRELTVTVKVATGGATVVTHTWAIDGPYIDEYDWCWGPPRANNKFVLSGILPYPEAEVTITVTAATGGVVGIGMAAIGNLQPLLLGNFGGAGAGAEVTTTDINYIKDNKFGVPTIVRRGNSNDMRVDIIMSEDDGSYALGVMRTVSGLPVAVIIDGSDTTYALNVFGMISGPVKYMTGHAVLSASVKGLF